MEKKVVTERYVFKGNDAAYKGLGNGELERRRDGRYELYDKDSIVNEPVRLVREGTIGEGIKIDNPDGKGIKYIFEAEDETTRYKHVVLIEKKYLEENRKYVEKLDKVSKETLTVRIKKTAKQVLKDTAIAFAFVTVFTGAMVAGMKLTDDGIDHDQIQIESFMEENNIYVDSHGNVHKGLPGEHNITEEDKISSIMDNLAGGNLSEEETNAYSEELSRLGYR